MSMDWISLNVQQNFNLIMVHTCKGYSGSSILSLLKNNIELQLLSTFHVIKLQQYHVVQLGAGSVGRDWGLG